MLVPVLDSLCLFYEAALGRRMEVGGMLSLSADEEQLLSLLDGDASFRNDVGQSAYAPLHCALCSARIMIGLSGNRCGARAN